MSGFGRSMMQTMRTLALLAICLSNASEAQTDTQADSSALQSGDVIDEIVESLQPALE